MNKKLLVTIIVLAIAVAILAYINREQLASRQALVDNPGILVMAAGEELATIHLEEIRQLGEKEFPIVLRSSGKPPRDLVLTGVPLRALLDEVDPALLEHQGPVVVRAIDAYTVAYSMEEVFREEHLYLVYLENGEPLGSRNEGGLGPLLIVPRQDEFGQRWCKYAVEVDIK